MTTSPPIDPGPGPHPQTGTSSSQHTLGEASKLLSKSRRIASDRDEIIRFNDMAIGHLPAKKFLTVEQLRAMVFDVLVQRLKVHNITSSALKMQNFLWLSHEDEWRLLLEDSLMVSPPMIATMINLEPSTAESPDPAPNSVAFYIRTFHIRVRDLRDVCTAMLHDGYDTNPRIFVWVERIMDLSDNAYVTLRYCGQSKNKPWDRHVSDIYSKSLRTFLSQFLKTVGMICSEVLKTSTVHTVYEATSVHQALELSNLREQVLIALFGDGVLNTKVGGKDIIVLVDEDRQLFHELKTDTLSLLQQTRQCSNALLSRIREYSKAVREYVKDHPTTTTGKGKHVFSDKTEEIIIRQGTPRVLSDDSAILVSLGTDIGDSHGEEGSSFFEAGVRASEIINHVYNHLGYWETGVLSGSFDHTLTKRLAKENCLPFVDLFPWFVKHEDDYKMAGHFTTTFMNAVRPFVVLAYGTLPTYAATNNFRSFTLNEYESHRIAERRKFGYGHWVMNIMGIPQLASFNGGNGTTEGRECVVIPSCHPGLLGHVGIRKDKLTRLLVMISGIAWSAATFAIQLDQNEPSLTRKQKCIKIIGSLANKLKKNTVFGQAFQKAKEDYVLADTTWHQSKWARQSVGIIRAPDRKLLPGKTKRLSSSRIKQSAESLRDISSAFEVVISEQPWNGAGGKDKSRFRLTWREDDGMEWSIAPIILPANVFSTEENDKRFLCYTPTGIDICNNAGISLGDRKPLANGATKSETLPIASLVITLSEQANANEFFKHWEDVTGTSIEEVLRSFLPSNGVPDSNEAYYPMAFFAKSKSRRALPFTSATLSAHGYEIYLNKVRKDLPAHSGDLLWLIDRFLFEMFPEGGEIDLINASIHGNSVYRLIGTFCSKARYKHHPHLRTFLALASMAEMGLDERNVSSYALTLAAEILRGPFISRKSKTVNIKVGGQNRSASRFVLTIKKDRPEDVVYEEDEPELEQDVEVFEDATDEEGEVVEEDQDIVMTEDDNAGQVASQGTKRGRSGHDHDNGEGSSKTASKALKGKGRAHDDGDDEFLLG